MIADSTDGIEAAQIYTGIYAFHVHAGFISGTVRVLHTLRSTVNIGITKIFGQAGARACTIAFFTNGV